MKKNNSVKIVTFVFCLLALPFFQADGGPIVIRDARVRDAGYTPALGRGYSLATGTYSSICLKDIIRTKPSYDFRYTFEQLDADGKRTSEVSVGTRLNFGVRYFGFRVNLNAKSRTRVREGKTYTRQDILVTLYIDQYYDSVNEAQSYLSNSARTLLENEDIPGFFDSCGVYYIRSIGRFSKFQALFTYESETRERDLEFELQLEASIGGWGRSGSFSIDIDRKISEEASKRNLIIRTTAFGMGKNQSASLISYDLKSFKTAIRDAFISMQNEDVGKVASIEIVLGWKILIFKERYC